jgi:hypothetical protein
MAPDQPQNLYQWFHDLALEIKREGTPAEITSGLACVHHRLAEATKDCDIWIPPASLKRFRELAATRPWQGTHAIYRSGLSAPLDSRWLDGGWSAHLVWPGPPRAQLDIFGRLPRVPHHTSNEIFSDEETLARVKMTQREKDWPTVHLLGESLVAKGNPTGLVFLQTAESLAHARAVFSEELWKQQASLRPLLNCLDTEPRPAVLAAHLRTEQTFWRQVDRHRLECYRAAGKDYARAAHRALNTPSLFSEQDLALTKIAEDLLPPRPLHGKAGGLVELAAEEALIAIDQSLFHSSWLPMKWALSTLELSTPS